MTRSSAKRRNRNARMIVRLVPATDAAHRYSTEGAFDANDARRWVRNASPYLWPQPPDEVSWELCSELLNRKSRVSFRIEQPGFTPTPRHSARPPIAGHILWDGVM